MLLVALIVAALAVVQSLFGVGLLVFGTPTLLLLGYPFADALAILLPASITISLLQVWKSRGQNAAFIRMFAGWCLVPLAVSLALILTFDRKANFNLVVAGFLAVFVVLRVYPHLSEKAQGWVTRHEREWLVLMGIVHGVSNLGGALLLIFAASRSRDKLEIRAIVAFCYACFASVQLALLAVLTPAVFSWAQLMYAAIAAVIFLSVGQRVFRRVSAPAFNSMLTGLAGAYAVILGLKGFGVI